MNSNNFAFSISVGCKAAIGAGARPNISHGTDAEGATEREGATGHEGATEAPASEATDDAEWLRLDRPWDLGTSTIVNAPRAASPLPQNSPRG